MKKEKITIKSDYTKIRNDLHFQVQLKTRIQIQESKRNTIVKNLKRLQLNKAEIHSALF